MSNLVNSNNILSRNQIRTPCIGVCSTTIGDLVCKGCKRFAHEVIDWNKYTDKEKKIVMTRVRNFMERSVTRYVRVIDRDKLMNAMESFGFRYRKEDSPTCWTYDLLRQTQGRIRRLGDVGLQREPGFDSLSIEIIWRNINRDFLIMSEGYFERFFRQPLHFE